MTILYSFMFKLCQQALSTYRDLTAMLFVHNNTIYGINFYRLSVKVGLNGTESELGSVRSVPAG